MDQILTLMFEKVSYLDKQGYRLTISDSSLKIKYESLLDAVDFKIVQLSLFFGGHDYADVSMIKVFLPPPMVPSSNIKHQLEEIFPKKNIVFFQKGLVDVFDYKFETHTSLEFFLEENIN